jgi:hypothetical protein
MKFEVCTIKPGQRPGVVVAEHSAISATELADYITAHPEEIAAKIQHHGGLFLTGFRLQSPDDFELVARAIDPDLKKDYQGTSPRNVRSSGGFVFSASELPSYYPIMQHCEMSFLARPPRKLFFWCQVEPATGSGETPICDFRAVWRGLNPKIREEFDSKGILILRTYTGPETTSWLPGKQLKPWHELLNTRNRDEATEKCRHYGYEFEWIKGNRLRIADRGPASIIHPVTGERVWFNHSQVFHPAAASLEYSQIVRLRPSFRHRGLRALINLVDTVSQLNTPEDELPMTCRFGDGSPIPKATMAHVLQVIWRHLVVFRWRQGDMLVLDNLSTSHGRLPYSGPRDILVCWAGEEERSKLVPVVAG